MEYLQGLSKKGTYLKKKIDRQEAHEKGLWHKSIHVWVVDPNKKKYDGDIGIHVALRANQKSFNGEPYLQRTAGGHMDYVENIHKITNGQNFTDKKSLQTFIRETKEELGVSLLQDNTIIEKKNINLIGKNIKYYNTKTTNVNGKNKKEINNEYVDIYSFESDKNLNDFDKKEIASIQIIPSNQLLYMLEHQPEQFQISDPNSRKAKMIKYVIYQLQNKYGVTRKYL